MPVKQSLMFEMVASMSGNMVDPYFLDSKRRTERMRGSLRLCSERSETKERIPPGVPEKYSLILKTITPVSGNMGVKTLWLNPKLNSLQ